MARVVCKQAKSVGENYKTTIRNIRRDGNDDLKKQQKAGEITEDQLKNEKTFVEILPEMEEFIEGLPLVAHNACVERSCIHDCCAFYKIETSIPYDEIMDTYLLSKIVEEKLGMSVSGAGSHSLNIVCQRFGVQELRHHHACDDAEMCGNLFLIFPRYLSGELDLDVSACIVVSEGGSRKI